MERQREGSQGSQVSRRDLLRASLGGLGLLLAGGKRASPQSEEAPDDIAMAVLVDLTRCIGCRACENACRTRLGSPPLPQSSFGYGAGEGRLSFTSWTFVDFPVAQRGREGEAPVPVKKQCMHCVDPACVSVCPVGALHKTPRGSVVYREDRCIGCRYCMIACPFGVPRYEWQSGLTPRVGKCDFCDDRIAAGLVPACVSACPTGALRFGKRADILRQARARLDAEPSHYRSLYGDGVVGGTSWLYISDIPAEDLGFRSDLPDYPLPSLTWKTLAKIPLVIVGLGIVLSGVYRLKGGKTAHG